MLTQSTLGTGHDRILLARNSVAGESNCWLLPLWWRLPRRARTMSGGTRRAHTSVSGSGAVGGCADGRLRANPPSVGTLSHYSVCWWHVVAPSGAGFLFRRHRAKTLAGGLPGAERAPLLTNHSGSVKGPRLHAPGLAGLGSQRSAGLDLVRGKGRPGVRPQAFASGLGRRTLLRIFAGLFFLSCLWSQVAWGAGASSPVEQSGLHAVRSLRATSVNTPGGGAAASRAGGTDLIATFRVTVPPTPASSSWTVSGLGREVNVGAPMLTDPEGRTSGYHVNAVGGPITITGITPWLNSPRDAGGSPLVTTSIAALFASNNNPPTRPVLGGVIIPGGVPDLGVYNAGSGAGWVATDHQTGNGLLLRVVGAQAGSPACYSTDPRGCTASASISQLNSESPYAFAQGLGASSSVISALYNAVPGNQMMVAYGCTATSWTQPGQAGTCVSNGLQVTLTPVGVIRADVLTGSADRGGAISGNWSPAGFYYLYLTGVMIFG